MVKNRNLNRNANSAIVPKYMPVTINMQLPTKSIFDTDANVILGGNIDYPRCSIGFHHYHHSLKKDSLVLKEFENKKKVYLVTNEFEKTIDNYDNGIENVATKYFQLDKKGKIASYDFYSLWELLFMFDLVNTVKPNFVSAHIAETKGGLTQATMFFRDKYSKQGVTKDDKFYLVKLSSQDTKDVLPEINKEFEEYYLNEKPKRVFEHKTGPNSQNGGGITDPQTLQTLFGGANATMKEKADFITAGSEILFSHENVMEQEYYKILFAQILTAMTIQKKTGNLVCKFFETYTNVSAKMISILMSLYEKVYFVKPLTSKLSDPDKYAVCINFKYHDNDKEYTGILKKMNRIHDELHKNPKLRITDIFTEYSIPKELAVRVTEMNIILSNKQFKAIGEMVMFVLSQNYYGDAYQEYRQKQIEASNFWVELFFPDPKNYAEVKAMIANSSFLSNKINVESAIKLEKEIV